MPPPSEKRVVRVAAVAVVAAGAAVPAAMTVPSRLPALATGSALLLYVERALAIFGVLVLALVFLYRGWHGQLPRSVSEKGAEWETLPVEAEAAEDGVQQQIDALSLRLDEIQQMLADLGGSRSTITP